MFIRIKLFFKWFENYEINVIVILDFKDTYKNCIHSMNIRYIDFLLEQSYGKLI